MTPTCRPNSRRVKSRWLFRRSTGGIRGLFDLVVLFSPALGRTEAICSTLPARPQAKAHGLSRAEVSSEFHKYDTVVDTNKLNGILQNCISTETLGPSPV